MRRVLAGLLAGALAAGLAAVVPGPVQAAPAPAAASSPVVEKRVIGQSVQGRDIVAYRIGEPGLADAPKVVLIATMHGNEPAPRRMLRDLVTGHEVVGADLWVVPTYNPDGLAAGTRKNAHGVDLNRNFPYRWADLDGSYESGPRAGSEPETRAMMRFLRSVRPDRVLSFHQPLNGVDTDTKIPAFARRVARALDLPMRSFDCGGVCQGTMTGWFNDGFAGAALTVEYGASPSRERLRKDAPKVLGVFGAYRGSLVAHPLAS